VSRVSYVNGRYLPHAHAMVSIEDRGLQFADGVYEVVEVFNRIMVDGERHFARLAESLKKLEIPQPMSNAAMMHMLQELLRRNHRRDCLLYLQINRGVSLREHGYPKHIQPSVMASILPARTPSKEIYQKGIAVRTLPDPRWARCDIKTVSLLGNIMAKHEATSQGAKDAILLDEKGDVREASSSNVFIVTSTGELWTHPATQRILGGITRLRIFDLAHERQIPVREKIFSREELLSAKEVFLSSSSTHVLPVVEVDGQKIGDGRPGAMSHRLLAAYHDYVLEKTGKQCPLP
jgi:D-alanine transaminase